MGGNWSFNHVHWQSLILHTSPIEPSVSPPQRIMAATNKARSLSSNSRALNFTANSNLGSMISLNGFLKLRRNSLVTKPLPLATKSPSLFMRDGSMAKIASWTPYFSNVTCGEQHRQVSISNQARTVEPGCRRTDKVGDGDSPGHSGRGPQTLECTWQTLWAPAQSPPWCTDSGRTRGRRSPWSGGHLESTGSILAHFLLSRACPRRRSQTAEARDKQHKIKQVKQNQDLAAVGLTIKIYQKSVNNIRKVDVRYIKKA